MKRNVLALLVSLAAVAVVAVLGGLTTAPAIQEWYRELNRPAFTPPDWLFGPAWTVLYASMAVAAWLVWRHGGEAARPALLLYGVQLLLNGSWSPVFFGLRSPGLGLLVIVPLVLAVAATLVAFFRVRHLAGWLLVPYLAWVVFATALNFSIWRLN